MVFIGDVPLNLLWISIVAQPYAAGSLSECASGTRSNVKKEAVHDVDSFFLIIDQNLEPRTPFPVPLADVGTVLFQTASQRLLTK